MNEKIIVRSQYRRKIELKRKFKLLWISLTLLIVLVICLSSFISKAATNDETIYYKYYTCIEVQTNDNLWTIANQYKGTAYESTQSYIDEVLEINNKNDDMILTGEQLVIPYYAKKVKL